METKEELLKTYKDAKAELKEREHEAEKNPNDFNREKVEEFQLIVNGLKDDLNKSRGQSSLEDLFNVLKGTIKIPKKIYIARVVLLDKYLEDKNGTTLDVKINDLFEIATLKEVLSVSLGMSATIESVEELEVK